MRLWSVHPAILDRQGLGGAWREGLGAQAVIRKLYETFYIYGELIKLRVSLGTIAIMQSNGRRIGYLAHSAMRRFLATDEPLETIGTYLSSLYIEACNRNYKYDKDKILKPDSKVELTVTSGQLAYEHKFILAKLRGRSPEDYKYFANSQPMAGAMFRVTSGEVEEWEKVQ